MLLLKPRPLLSPYFLWFVNMWPYWFIDLDFTCSSLLLQSIGAKSSLNLPFTLATGPSRQVLSCETNLLKGNNELKWEVKKLTNKLERCYNTKVTFEHMLTNQRKYGDESGLGFNKSMTKGERKRERRMKKLLQKKLSHSMCYKCHEIWHLEKGCPVTSPMLRTCST